MVMSINTNVNSLTAQRNAAATQNSLAVSLQRLSSGLRVNSAKDDAAGLAIAERMNTQVRGMNVAIRNANDGISLAQTAEGGLATIGDMLQRMRELSVQSINSTNTSGDIAALNQEFTQLRDEVNRTVSAVQFNGTSLFTTTNDFSFQVGANSGQIITIAGSAMNINAAAGGMSGVTQAAGGASGLNTTANSANAAVLAALDTAIATVNDTRATLGAVQSRFENTINFLRTSVENQAAARGRIMDADFASETANLSRSQILQQAGTAMIAQANQLPQGVLALLR
ncbi:flagellin N-terminal helical domain-containing protein [Serpentinimonas barnesii]|uniref:flagellin N-terminal helical domain-containing protein n=1 Tax=Serpentinimonas barnesii TaxID=1458427 RepID=UPI0004958BEA|nr:flagellin [Serpentinimonas barnesii]